MALYAPDKVDVADLEGIGINLIDQWHTKSVGFEGVTGKTDLGSFRFAQVNVGGRPYFLLALGTNEDYEPNKMMPVLDLFTKK
ncbi:MAG: hypothetical protein ACFFDT_24680 [Candidatus Hodarchaeota archaeon]